MSWPESLERWFPLFDFPLFRLGNTTVTVATLLTVLIIVVATLIVSRVVGGGGWIAWPVAAVWRLPDRWPSRRGWFTIRFSSSALAATG